MTINQIIKILLARWRISAIVAATILAVTALITFVVPKKYTATAAVLIDVRNPDPVQGITSPSLIAPGYMATQIDILTSDQVGRRVVSLLRLEQSSLKEKWQEQTDGKGNFEAWASDILSKSLDVRPSRESNVINISYTAADPKFAAALANAYVRAYTETSLTLKTQPATQSTEFFEERAAKAKQALERAREAYTNYQREHNLVSGEEQLDDETAKLNALATTLVSLRAQSADTNSRQSQVGKRSDQINTVMENPVVLSLRSELARAETKLKELTSRYGDRHPDVQLARASLQETRDALSREVARASGSVNVSNSVAQAREAEVKRNYEEQRKRVLQLKEARDTALVLAGDVQVAQRTYETILARANQTELESVNTQTNVIPLTPAVEPSQYSSPNELINFIAGTAIAIVLGILAAIVFEFGHPLIRGTEDITKDLNYPILGVMPSGQMPTPGTVLSDKPNRKVIEHKRVLRLPGISAN